MDAPRPVNLSDYLARPAQCEPHLLRLFSADRELVIFDIGACEGEESIRYARLFPKARIFTFEPLPANQEIIRSNFSRFNVSRAELVPLALSDKTGTAEFHVSAGRPPELFCGDDWNYGNKSSSLLPPAETDPMHGWIHFPEKITVQTETLDRFCERRGIGKIDFIHMDVQGAESLVLAGADLQLPRVGALWLEVSDRELYKGQKLRTDIERIMRRRRFWLATESRGEIEGDQLYVNLRTSAGLVWWLGARLRPLRRLLTRLFSRK